MVWCGVVWDGVVWCVMDVVGWCGVRVFAMAVGACSDLSSIRGSPSTEMCRTPLEEARSFHRSTSAHGQSLSCVELIARSGQGTEGAPEIGGTSGVVAEQGLGYGYGIRLGVRVSVGVSKCKKVRVRLEGKV